MLPIQMRVTPEQMDKLRRSAKRRGLTLANVGRQVLQRGLDRGALDSPESVEIVLDPEVTKLRKELNKIGVNLNQAVRLLHQRDPSTLTMLEANVRHLKGTLNATLQALEAVQVERLQQTLEPAEQAPAPVEVVKETELEGLVRSLLGRTEQKLQESPEETRMYHQGANAVLKAVLRQYKGES